jgi:hypothetical protein
MYSKRFLASCLLAFAPLAAQAGGSIVINASSPAADLVYQDQTGSSRQLRVSWSDIQIMDATRRFMVSEFGRQGQDQPFYIHRNAQKVSYYSPVERKYIDISFSDLLNRN